MVWREGNTGRSGNWTGPFKLLEINDETCHVELPSGPTEFRSTVVKPYNQTEPETEPKSDPKSNPKSDPKSEPKSEPETEPEEDNNQGQNNEEPEEP